MIKLIAADLDKTFLRTDKTLSPYTRDVLSRCRYKGIKLAIATARPVRTAGKILEGVKFDGAVYHNGALSVADGRTVYSHPIPTEDVFRVTRAALNALPDIWISAEINGLLFTNRPVDANWNMGVPVDFDFSVPPPAPAEKLILHISGPEDMRAFSKTLPPSLYAISCDGKLALVLDREATKFNGVAALAGYWNIPVTDTAAFGDDFGDISMLSGCGVGVAAGNALDDVKKAADHVCGPNDEDGPARWLEDNVLNI